MRKQSLRITIIGVMCLHLVPVVHNRGVRERSLVVW